MIFERNTAKAASNLRRHGVSVEEAASVFLDPLALTFPDPDHSADEEREITFGASARQRIVVVSHRPRGDRIPSSAPAKQPGTNRFSMKKASTRNMANGLRKEYDLSRLGTGVRGK